MKLDVQAIRHCLKTFNFKTLFREHLGWDNHHAKLEVPVNGTTVSLTAIAQKRGFVTYLCTTVPDRPTRLKIDHQVTKSTREHFIIYTDADAGHQVWQWVRREPGKPMASRDHRYVVSQSGDALIQRLDQIAFSLEDEEELSVTGVSAQNRKAWDVEKVSRQFFDSFQGQHAALLKFLKGIPSASLQSWYASVLLNRLMFIYFIQKKGFLGDHDRDYLRHQLDASKTRGKDRFYRDVLWPLFFDGFAKRETDRSSASRKLLGVVPYLNGGLFLQHQIEKDHGADIILPDRAFESIFSFFDDWDWHLDDRAKQTGKEINPNVLGSIFEKYINQKQMGAYYTKEDITEYIARSTIIPFLFERTRELEAKEHRTASFTRGSALWSLLRETPDRYIFPEVRHGVIDPNGQLLEPPPEIVEGLADATKRAKWNRVVSAPFGLPTETCREYIARRQHCLDLRSRLDSGDIATIDEFVTLNIDLRQFFHDVIENCESPESLASIYTSIVNVSVLDPTCGSGAFLFAALNILEPLYEACLDRMEAFLDEASDKANQTKTHNSKARLVALGGFQEILDTVNADHPNRAYFIFKSIILNNLYGVDLMDEATEICRLRLFLKLASQVERDDSKPNLGIEPLPDIDFNICAGNTLVGFTSIEAVRKVQAGQSGDTPQFSFAEDEIQKIEREAHGVDQLFAQFRRLQTMGGKSTATSQQLATTKDSLRKAQQRLASQLNSYLAGEYGISPSSPKQKTAFVKWCESHRPFHWITDFYGIMRPGGFDIIIGNPPYVSAAKVRDEYTIRGYATERCTDIYAWVLERVADLLSPRGRSGMIVPLSLGFSDDFNSCRRLLFERYSENWFSSFGRIPSALFNFDVRVRNTIHIGARSSGRNANHTTRLHRWFEESRKCLFPTITYAEFNPSLWAFRIPKLNTTRLVRCFEQSLSHRTVKMGATTQPHATKHRLYFKKTAYNWLNFCRRLPPCYDANGKPIEHTKFGEVYFATDQDRDVCFLLLNGKIEFSFWIAVGDDFDVTKWMFTELPLDPTKLNADAKMKLVPIADELDKAMRAAISFKLNAGKKVGNYNVARCRDVTDQSDAILASHLGFSDAWDDVELLYSQIVKTSFDDEE